MHFPLRRFAAAGLILVGLVAGPLGIVQAGHLEGPRPSDRQVKGVRAIDVDRMGDRVLGRRKGRVPTINHRGNLGAGLRLLCAQVTRDEGHRVIGRRREMGRREPEMALQR